ncbi:hypothetical protein [Blastomonas sp. SL216]|uniref:hypothetical protein n=1 Tax=Blastomonas sp. SL216 TaxID=2995169 RepID=UPI002377BE6D|nr:hypothetical protein OU999_06785 [Blastomonas sp. SL216]
MLLDQDLMVLAASGPYCRSFGMDPVVIVGQSLFAQAVQFIAVVEVRGPAPGTIVTIDCPQWCGLPGRRDRLHP